MERAPVNLRNLEQIQEGGSSGRTRLWTVVLSILGSAAVASASLAMSRPGTVEAPKEDPLSALVQAAQKEGAREAELRAEDIDYPELLSDAEEKTTALVAVKDENGKLIEARVSEPVAEAPSVPRADSMTALLERLPVVPLPAGTKLNQTTVTEAPKDELLRIAVSASELPEDTPLAEPGTEGGYLVQVASFKNQADADSFVMDLRRRGYSAFRQAANVPGRGLWHRVRIGSFKTKYEAELYKRKLGEKERISALVIDPEKVERAERVRAEKLAERIRRFGSE